MELGSSLQNQRYGITSQNGIYRAAFPAFRVFIYGQEVSGDVIEVRVNQSGGSMDRSPGTCSLSLANIGDKYILDHADMVALAQSRDLLITTLGENVNAYKEMMAYLRDGAGEDENVVAEMGRILSSSGRFAELTEYTSSLYSDLLAKGMYQQYWDENKVPDNLKYKVIQKKAPMVVPGWQDLYEAHKSDGVYLNIFFEHSLAQLGFVYPFAEGDCIFHPNDPIRIAFRDPFDPSIWYWMFTGFVDGWVEDRGVNQESIVTITGTDVSKIARYSFFQTNTDAVRDKAITSLFPIFEGTTTDIKWTAYADLFAHFTVFEILELLFFGLESYTGAVTEFTQRALAQMNDNEVNQFLLHHATGKSVEEIKGMASTEKRTLARTFMEGNKPNRFQGSHVPPLQTPNGTVLQRKNAKYGTYAFFVGKADNYDKSMGEEVLVSDLRRLNDFLNHRVSLADMMTMGVTTSAKNYTPPTLTLNDVITTIGTDIEGYPVGAGYAVYVAPATLGLGISSGVMSEVVNASMGGLHSEYKDRLTYLYDLAEQIQFCFYATPKGDIVFEMPFYDFDPWMFDEADTFQSNEKVRSAAEYAQSSLENVRSKVEAWSKGSAKYSEFDIYRMMQLSSNLQLLEEGFTLKEPEDDRTVYSQLFTVDKHETYGFSNAVNDSGLKTISRCGYHPFSGRYGVEVTGDVNMVDYQYALAPELAPLLGFRMASDKTPWTEVTTEEGAKIFASVELRKCNSEARNLSIQILPRFGLMVNRPLYWRQRNYVANIVSCSHSISVNSSCESQVNVNFARAWKGEYQSGSRMEIFRHFGGDYPFSYAALLKVNK